MIRAVTAIVSVLFAAACSTPRAIEASLPSIEDTSTWRLSKLDSQTLIHEPTGQSISFAPLNHPRNRGADLFIWITTGRKRDRLLVPVSAVKLQLRDREYAAQGWECPTNGQPVRPHGDRPIEFLDSDKGCGLLQSNVAPPESTEQFSLSIQEVRVGGISVEIPKIYFAPGELRFRGGFQ